MRAHVIGIPGSGKTTLARRLGEARATPTYDLDRLVYEEVGVERTREAIVARLDEIRATARWITEGAYHDAWLDALLADADHIVWLDVPFSTCAARIIKRHVRAELARNNPHPGWRRLARFLNYTRATAARQRRETEDLLAPYSRNVEHCRSSRDVAVVRRSLSREPERRA